MTEALRISTATAALAIFLIFSGCSETPVAPFANKGLLDLSDWRFDISGPARLDGEWEFCWNAAYDPALPDNTAADATTDYLRLPGLWRGHTANGVPLSPMGRGYYTLQLRLPPDSPRLSLLVSGPLSVCRVWTGGRLLASTGQPGADKESEKPLRHIMTPSFSAAGQDMTLLLEVSNHHNMQGGLNSSILLGTESQINRILSFRQLSGAFIGGALLIMCVYHLALFAMRQSENANLYFSLFCLMWVAATVFSPSSGFLASQLFPLPWRLGVDFSLLPYGFTIPLLVVFYHSLFPKRWAKPLNAFYIALGAAYVLYILATPPNAYDTVPLLYFLLTRTAFLYLFGAFIMDLMHKEKGVFLLLPGYLALALAEFDDILFDLNMRSTDLAFAGVFVFVLFYSFFMSMRYARMAANVDHLSAQLEAADASRTPSPMERKRRLAVRVIKLSVDCWEAATGATKADLAEESGIWNVYMEKDGYRRTQTLDKYLSEATLPKRPRWKNVRDTALFVLARCKEQKNVCNRLEEELQELKSL